MSFGGSEGRVSAVLRRLDSVAPLERATSSVRFTAPGSVTEGEFGLFRWEMTGQGGGPHAHFHRTFSESFYVLDGLVGLYNGKDWSQARSGDFLYVPRGGIHGFRNDQDERSAMLILFAPGIARERFFEATTEIANSGRQLTPEEWTAFYAEHDQYMV